jgi:DNA primase
MIPDDVVDEVRLRADLVEVVSESVPLKRSGKEWKGKCPFHDDRTPSFYVVPDKGFYKCFGCGESGDIFGFVMKQKGLDFLESVRYLGGRYGVEIREESGQEDDPLQHLHEANAFAKSWFRSCLLDPERGAPARRYLEDRGIGEEVLERFGIGFAPEGWRGLRDAAAKHGMTDELLLEIGLLTTSEKASEPYDRFRGRVIFPIESTSGRVVAFGGRVIGGEGKGVPKYLNSPESPVYHKGEVLYGLSWNRHEIRREGLALIVEGYMDVVALAAFGFGNAVAPLGTAVTEEQARLLARYTRKVLLLFDSDEAGERAAFRAADVLLSVGVHPSIVLLPPGEDPDTVVRGEGPEALRACMDRAVDILDRKLQILDEKGYFKTIERVRGAVDKLLPTLRAVRDPALRDIYIATVSRRTGVTRDTLVAEVERVRPSPGAARPGGSRTGPVVRQGRPARGKLGPGTLGPERQLLLVLVRNRDWVDRTLERIGPEEFRDPVHRAIFEALVQDPERRLPPEGLSPEALLKFEELMADPEDVEHTERIFQDAMAELQDRAVQQRQEEIRTRLLAAGSEEEKRTLVQELAQLRRERRGRWNVIRREGPAGINVDVQQVEE